MSTTLTATSSTRMTRSSIGRLRMFYMALLNMSASMTGSSPIEVLQKFVDLLTQAGPRLQTLVSVITPWALLITAITEHDWIRDTCGSVKASIMSYIDASITINSGVDMHRHLLKWMTSNAFGQDMRTLQLVVPNFMETETVDPHADAHLNTVGEPLHYAPAVGQYTYMFEGHRLSIERVLVQREGDKDDIDFVKVSCLSPFAGPRVVKAFLDHVKHTVAVAMVNHTFIFKVNDRGCAWEGHPRPSRNLNAVTLDQGVKNALVQDIGAYLNPKSRRYYSNRGIPWRRGFLFYGPPGTGKTSFTTALAGHFNLNVFVLSLSAPLWDDARLEQVFMQIPSKCIVLIEDIDTAGIQREQMKNPAAQPSKNNKWLSSFRANKPMEEQPQLGITLSGLLNVIDGMHAIEGRILILTSNKPDSLDEALIRRGRIDQRVLFGYASRAVSAELFEHVFVKSAEELLENELPRDREEIAQLAQQFANSFPPDMLTPADVQGFLLDHRADPVAAVNTAALYAESIMQQRAMGTNVASFTHGRVAGAGIGAALKSVKDTLLQSPFTLEFE